MTKQGLDLLDVSQDKLSSLVLFKVSHLEVCQIYEVSEVYTGESPSQILP